jgi:hypothetical protein
VSGHALEERVRAALHRRAADIEVDPPPWDELVGRAGGVVVPLRPTDAGAAHLRPTRRHRLPRVSLRPALATVAALLVALGAAVVVEGRGSSGTGGETPADGGDEDTTVALDVPDTPVIPSPGSTDFVPRLATAVPVDTSGAEAADADPWLLAQLYLRGVGLSGGTLESNGFELQVDPLTTDPADQADPLEGTVWWSVRDRSGAQLTIGAVFVRVADPGALFRTWEVAGAFTSSTSSLGTLTLGGVRRAGGVLAFDVGAYFPDPTARVMVDGVEVHEGRIPGGSGPFAIEDPAPDRVVTIQLQHLEGGVPVAITAMAVAPERVTAVVVGGTNERGGMPAPPGSTGP